MWLDSRLRQCSVLRLSELFKQRSHRSCLRMLYCQPPALFVPAHIETETHCDETEMKQCFGAIFFFDLLCLSAPSSKSEVRVNASSTALSCTWAVQCGCACKVSCQIICGHYHCTMPPWKLWHYILNFWALIQIMVFFSTGTGWHSIFERLRLKWSSFLSPLEARMRISDIMTQDNCSSMNHLLVDTKMVVLAPFKANTGKPKVISVRTHRNVAPSLLVQDFISSLPAFSGLKLDVISENFSLKSLGISTFSIDSRECRKKFQSKMVRWPSKPWFWSKNKDGHTRFTSRAEHFSMWHTVNL